ncbi:MAG: hypothetical protein NVSMB45_12070 [Ginsengibacter sp.]
MQTAILIHNISWAHSSNSVEISKGLTFININNHQVEKLYYHICEKDKIDESSPYDYHIALIIDHDIIENVSAFPHHSDFPSHSEYALSTSALNILTILKKGILGFCRVITSSDNFQTCNLTFRLYETATDYIDELTAEHGNFENETARNFRTIWNNLQLFPSGTRKSRIENALNFFYFSWQTLSLEQTGICLSIVLETLFTPNSNNELTHQISYNIANFFENKKSAKIERYRYIKKYYSIRSKLVHGESINDNELLSIKEYFKFVCDLILKIISDKELILIFNDNKSRIKYLEEQLFT